MNEKKITVGQKLWMVYDQWHRKESQYVTVTKVGRLYATIDVYGVRVRLNNWRAVGDYLASFYQSQEAYEAICALRHRIQNMGVPQHLTLDRIAAMNAGLDAVDGGAQ